jgi:hypothetical protein
MSEPPSKRTYTQEEVTEILKRAMKQQSLEKQGLSHEELVEMAGEVGIDRAAVESATAELTETRADEMARREGAAEIAEERARLFNALAGSLFYYVVIGGMLYFIDRRFTGGTWYFWVLMAFAIALLFRVRALIFPHGSLARRKARELKRARKLERRALREAKHQQLLEAFGVRRSHRSFGHALPTEPLPKRDHRHTDVEAQVNAGAREFETAVQAGVAALLNVAARKIHEHASRAAEGDRSSSFKRRR